MPNIGGSGGAGCYHTYYSWPGGLGGGAITVASDSITGSGQIFATGSAYGHCYDGGSSGSGGGIRFVANTINFSGSFNACSGNCGVVRLEATNLTFSGTSSPGAVLSLVNPVVATADLPELTISSVGGYTVPPYSGTRFDTVDLLLPNQLPDPVNVIVSGVNIPVGSPVQVGFVSGSPSGSSTPCNLVGTFASSSCTATISNMNRTAVTYLLATTAFEPPTPLAKHNPKGKNHVAKISMETALGGKTKYVFINEKGKEIARDKLKKEFLAYFRQ